MPDVTLDGLSCTRCGHKWVPRGPSRPFVCPKCKSIYWDRPRKKGKGDTDGSVVIPS